MKKLFGKPFLLTLICILFIEFISLLSWNDPSLNKIFFLSIILIAFIVSLKKLEWGIYIICAELFISSKGYLLAWPLDNFSISLRLGLFIVLFSAYLIWLIRDKEIKFFKTRFWKYYLAFMFIMFISLLIGYLHHNEIKNIFFDSNGYLYFGLLFPLAQAIDSKEKIYKIISVLFAAGTYLIAKTLILLFIFSQNNFFGVILIAIYKWVRDTGVGEITQMPNGFSRIFFQSHIYNIIIFFIGLAILSLISYKDALKKYWWIIFSLAALSLLTIFLSYSRSFWVGLLFTLFLFFLCSFLLVKVNFKKLLVIFVVLVLVCLTDYAIALGIVNLPLPGNSSISISSLISERTKDPAAEAAGSSRMELLKPLWQKNLSHPFLGSGFGTTVTYKTNDPRALEQNPDGNYTTYAFEWGYLDLWLKFGLIGTIIYLLLLYKIFRVGYVKFKNTTETQDKALLFGTLLGFVSIIIIHCLTPYLNHPLGIGWILIISQFYNIKS